MQTVTLSNISQRQVNTRQFLNRIRRVNVRRELRGEEQRFEQLDAPFAETIQSGNMRVNGLATAIVRSRQPGVSVETTVEHGYLEKVERAEELQDFARVWIGHRSYALFVFLTGSPGGTYSSYRRFVAQSLTQDPLDDDQQLVVPIVYDLPCVRQRFGNNIWEQNFLRNDAIRRGRIRGTAMQNDPLYNEFQHIGTFIGVEIPITGSQQMVKVFSDGRLQFMGLQPQVLENPDSRDAALDVVIQVADRLAPCEV
jgi:hypothetical protein